MILFIKWLFNYAQRWILARFYLENQVKVQVQVDTCTCNTPIFNTPIPSNLEKKILLTTSLFIKVERLCSQIFAYW